MDRVFDSGDDISHRTAMLKPYLFNNNAGKDDLITETIDKRSDDKVMSRVHMRNCNVQPITPLPLLVRVLKNQDFVVKS